MKVGFQFPPQHVRMRHNNIGECTVGQASFYCSFTGVNADGEMDVTDLAPVLLVLSDALLRANHVVNDGRAEAKIKIKATERGSFVLQLALDVSLADQVMMLLDSVTDHPDRVTAANQLLDLLIKGGKIAGGVALGVFGLVKWLGGRRPDKVIENKDGTVILIIGDERRSTTADGLRLLEDLGFREHVARLGERIGSLEGIDEVALGDDESPKAWRIEHNEASALRLPPPEEDVPEVVTSTRTVWLELVSVHFSEGYKWRFRDGENTFTAEVTDVDFLNKVQSGEVSLSAADKLFCEIEDEQEITSAEIKKVSTRVTRVLEYRPGARQMRLL